MSQTSAVHMAVDGKRQLEQDKMKIRAKPGHKSTASWQTKGNERSLFVPLTLLASLIPFGLLSMHALMHRNGYYASMVHLRDFGPHLLPGTQDPLVREYTGNGFLDYWLTVLVCFFANAVDGTEPELSVLGVVFAANMGPCLVLVYVESLRRERRWGLLWFACLWCLSMQTLSFGLTMPIYCIISLVIGPRPLDLESPQPQIESNSIQALRVLPWSITLGYIIPTILMCSRSFSSAVHQYLLAFWQPFPLWVALIQAIFSMRISRSLMPSNQIEVNTLTRPKISVPRPLLWMGPSSPFLQHQPLVISNSSRIATLHALAYAMNFASYCAAFLHWITIFVLFISRLVPTASILSKVAELSIVKTFVPANPFSPAQITAMPQGVLAFLQYDFYVGILAALIWTASRQYELEALKGNSSKTRNSTWILLVNVILFGPGATAVGYAYLREAELELMTMRRLD